MWHNGELWLLLAVPALIQAQSQGQNTTSNNGGGGGSSPSGSSSASIIGFAVVLSFLLLALCVVILLCLKFGTMKCPWSSARMRARPIFPRSSSALRDIQTETQVAAQTEAQPQGQQGERITSTNLNPIHGTINHMEEMQPRVLTLAQFSKMVSHSANTSIPNSPNPQSQNTRGVSAQTTVSGRPRVPPLQVRPVDPPPPYPAMGYPYQPCKSPAKAASVAQATTPITLVSYGAEIATPVTPAPSYDYGVQQLRASTPVASSEQSLNSRQLQPTTPLPYNGTEV